MDGWALSGEGGLGADGAAALALPWLPEGLLLAAVVLGLALVAFSVLMVALDRTVTRASGTVVSGLVRGVRGWTEPGEAADEEAADKEVGDEDVASSDVRGAPPAAAATGDEPVAGQRRTPGGRPTGITRTGPARGAQPPRARLEDRLPDDGEPLERVHADPR